MQKRGPEVASADLFGGLNPDQRNKIFAIMELLSDREAQDNQGGANAPERLEKIISGASDSQIHQVVKLNLKYVYGGAKDLSEADETLVKNLRKIGLTDHQSKQVKDRIKFGWLETRDWDAVNESLNKLLSGHSDASDETVRDIRCAALSYLRDKLDRNELAAKVKEAFVRKSDNLKPPAGALAQDLDKQSQLVDAIRSQWPPPAKSTARRDALIEEIRPLIRDREPHERSTIHNLVWKYATDEDYLRRELISELDDQNLDDEALTAVYEVAKNYWPPRHDDILEFWSLRFAEQAVLELPRASDHSSDRSFAGAAVASEKMSIAQRSRYLMSFLFHFGMTPLVSDEATGIEHNPLHRIWSIRQHRRSLEEEIARRFNGQILANPFLYLVEMSDLRDRRLTKPGVAVNKCASESQSPSDSMNEVERSEPLQKEPPNQVTLTPAEKHISMANTGAKDSQPKAKVSGPALPISAHKKAAIEQARHASSRWLDAVKRFDTLTPADFTDALKDELKTSISLTRVEAVNSVRREQLRQDLIRANRELMEWHLAELVGTKPAVPVSLQSKDRVFGRTVLKIDQEYRLWFFWRAGLIFVVALFAIDMNSTSLHGFYRTQIARNWIEPLDGVGRELPLAQLDTTAHGAPYHLISTSLNLMG